jgi:hypothetical protein
MLGRADSKSSRRTSHRKSRSSAYLAPEHIDPELARQQAQAAATFAFTRAMERKSGEMGSHTNNHRRASSHGQSLGNGGPTTLRRQQSVRFVQPNGLLRQPSMSRRAETGSVAGSSSAATQRPVALTNDTPVPAAFRPPSRSSSIGRTSIRKGPSAEEYVRELGGYPEYYTKEDDVASTPSSYRRIKKSKSTKTLVSPLRGSSIFRGRGSPDSDDDIRISSRAKRISNGNAQKPLRGPKSMSFLRGSQNYFSRREDRETAVQVARDTFLHQIEQQRLREQPSFIFRSRLRSEDKPFSKSLRRNASISSNLNAGCGETTPTGSIKKGSLRVKARKFRNALKSFFRRGGDQDELVTIPAQQVESQRSHGDESYTQHENASFTGFSDVPQPNDEALSRVATRVPSLRSATSAQQLRSKAGSIRSVTSNASSKSRVTSWTSTVENTINSRHTAAERERARLSIIQENGAHVSSSSRRPTVANQFSAYPMFHRPGSRGPPSNLTRPVDSQRLHSALLKRLDETSPENKGKSRLRHASSSDSLDLKRIPPRSSSIGSRHSSHRSQSPTMTIRHVRRDSRQHQPERRTSMSVPHAGDDVFKNSEAGPCKRRTSTSKSTEYGMPNDGIYNAYPVHKASNASLLSPQEMAARNELLEKNPLTLRETRSTFFGTSTLSYRRGTSPYRRALAESDYRPPSTANPASRQPSSGTVVAVNAPTLVLPTVELGDDSPAGAAYTESIYSRTTSGHTPIASPSLGFDDVLPALPPTTVYHSTPGTEPLSRRLINSESSQDWKGWLAAESSIAMNGAQRVPGITPSFDYSLPPVSTSFRHVRERTEISENESSERDGSVQRTRSVSITTPAAAPPAPAQQIRAPELLHPIRQPTQPSSQQHGFQHPKPILKHKSSIGQIDPNSYTRPNPLPSPPPVPTTASARAPLRTMPSKASLRSQSSASNLTRPVSRASTIAASATARQTPQPTPMTAKLVKRQRRPSQTQTRRGPQPQTQTQRRPSMSDRTLRPSQSTGNVNGHASSLSLAVEKQFGSARSRVSGMENQAPLPRDSGEFYENSEGGCYSEGKLRRSQEHGRNVLRRRASEEGRAFI